MNAIYFESKLDFIFEFVPQIVFMSLLFGYMLVMIFVKWSINWFAIGTQNAPSIITQLMNIFLAMGKVGNTPLWGASGSQENFHFYVLSKLYSNCSFCGHLHSFTSIPQASNCLLFTTKKPCRRTQTASSLLSSAK